MPASNYAGNKLLELICRGTAWTPPTAVYVSLHTADPIVSGANEMTTAKWPSYVRRNAANGGAVGTGFAAATGKTITNAQELLWPAMDGPANVVVTHYAVWDALTNGNCLQIGALATPKTLGPTDEIVLHAGALTVTVT